MCTIHPAVIPYMAKGLFGTPVLSCLNAIYIIVLCTLKLAWYLVFSGTTKIVIQHFTGRTMPASRARRAARFFDNATALLYNELDRTKWYLYRVKDVLPVLCPTLVKGPPHRPNCPVIRVKVINETAKTGE